MNEDEVKTAELVGKICSPASKAESPGSRVYGHLSSCLQEALWNVAYPETPRMDIAKAVFLEVVAVIRKKITWPDPVALRGWTQGECSPLVLRCLTSRADQREKFGVYEIPPIRAEILTRASATVATPGTLS